MTKPLIQQLAERVGYVPDKVSAESLSVYACAKLLFELCAYLDESTSGTVRPSGTTAPGSTTAAAPSVSSSVAPAVPDTGLLRDAGATSADADAESDRQALAVYRSETRALADGEEGPFALANVRHIQAKLAASEARVQELTGELEEAMRHGNVLADTSGPVVNVLKRQLAESARTIDSMRAVVEAARARLTLKRIQKTATTNLDEWRDYLHNLTVRIDEAVSALDARVEPVGEREIPGPIGAGDTVLCNFDTLKTLGKVIRVDGSAIPYLVEYETTELVRRETWADARHLKRLIAADPAPPVSESATREE